MRANFGKKNWLIPQPVLIITSYDKNNVPNAMNAAWGGMYDEYKVIICLSTEHKTTKNINFTKEFAINFPTSDYIVEADYFGICSGNEVKNKFEKTTRLSISKSEFVNAPIIKEFPLSLECKAIKIEEIDKDTTIIIGDIVNTSVDKKCLDINGNYSEDNFDFICYDPISHKYRKISDSIDFAFISGLKLK